MNNNLPRMATASERKLIASLKQSRHRYEHGLFVLEGTRSVADCAGSFVVKWLVATAAWLQEHAATAGGTGAQEILLVKPDEMSRLSAMSTPQGVMAICHIPEVSDTFAIAPDELVLALDRVQDPGNLGTIVRIADWFGIRQIVASPDTVDLFNPKVVQSTMGSLARVRVHYTPLPALLQRLRHEGVAVYGTFLGGTPLADAQLTRSGVIVMGNEGNGISSEVACHVSQRLTIPSYPPGEPTVESLNVAVATAITISKFREVAFGAGD